MTQGQLELKEADFWSDPLRTRAGIEARLLARKEEALLVDAPPRVFVDLRQTAPFVVLRTATIANAGRAPFARTAVLAAVNLDSNVTYAALAVRPSGRPGAARQPRSTEPFQEGMSGEAFVLDLRDALGVPWEPGRYVVTLLLRDAVSPRMRMEFDESPAKYRDPAVAAHRAEERLKTNVPPVSPPSGNPLPAYERRDASPPIPAKEGIALSAPRVFVSSDEGPCILRGSFRLPILRRHVVPAGPDPGAAEIVAQHASARRCPTGVVRITLVATGSESAVPFTWPLVVPTFDVIDPKAEAPVVTGYFAIDLQTLGNVKGVDQTLFVYAFSAEAMAGPAPIAFVPKAASAR